MTNTAAVTDLQAPDLRRRSGTTLPLLVRQRPKKKRTTRGCLGDKAGVVMAEPLRFITLWRCS